MKFVWVYKINSIFVPISGTASDVVGMDSATRFKNTVNDNKIVTPARNAVTETV